MEIVGMYTGDGKSGRHIVLSSTSPEPPTVVEVFTGMEATRGNRVTCTQSMWPGSSVDSSGWWLDDAIISLDPDGFTLGAHPSVNADAHTYHFIARLPVPYNDDMFFHPDCEWLREKLDSFDESWKPARKGKFLECIAGRLCSWIHGAEICPNICTSSAQIDLGVEIRSPAYLRYLGETWVVEAKNWQQRVDAKAVRDFTAKVRAYDSQLGILFTREGITGGDDANAQREVQRAKDQDKVFIMVLDFDDLCSIADGCNFLTMLKQKRHEVRCA